MPEAKMSPWCDASGAPIPGAPLLAAHALWRLYGAAQTGNEEAIRSLGVAPEQLNAARAFHALLAEAASASPDREVHIKACVGLSCRVEGAVAFHARLRADFAAAGLTLVTEEVHCLDQCLEGPNVRFAAEVFCSKSCAIVTDERTWRGREGGPQAVNSPNPPPVLG